VGYLSTEGRIVQSTARILVYLATSRLLYYPDKIPVRFQYNLLLLEGFHFLYTALLQPSFDRVDLDL